MNICKMYNDLCRCGIVPHIQIPDRDTNKDLSILDRDQEKFELYDENETMIQLLFPFNLAS